MTILKLACGKEIPLVYSTLQMLDIQEDVAPIEQAIRLVNGVNPDNKKDLTRIGGKEQLKALGAFLRILGNEGLRLQGQEQNLDDREVLSWIKPYEILLAVNACMEEMGKGMRSEIPAKDEGPVDVTLEELKKKKEKTA
jgi:hypothetical protein